MNVGTALQHLLTLGVLGFLISASISHHWIVLDQLSDESTRVGLWKICDDLTGCHPFTEQCGSVGADFCLSMGGAGGSLLLAIVLACVASPVFHWYGDSKVERRRLVAWLFSLALVLSVASLGLAARARMRLEDFLNDANMMYEHVDLGKSFGLAAAGMGLLVSLAARAIVVFRRTQRRVQRRSGEQRQLLNPADVYSPATGAAMSYPGAQQYVQPQQQYVQPQQQYASYQAAPVQQYQPAPAVYQGEGSSGQ